MKVYIYVLILELALAWLSSKIDGLDLWIKANSWSSISWILRFGCMTFISMVACGFITLISLKIFSGINALTFVLKGPRLFLIFALLAALIGAKSLAMINIITVYKMHKGMLTEDMAPSSEPGQ